MLEPHWDLGPDGEMHLVMPREPGERDYTAALCAFCTMVGVAVLVVALALALIAYSVKPAKAHDWYDSTCCNDRDCEPADGTTARVSETPDGYLVRYRSGVEVLVPYGDSRILITPPGPWADYHVCTSMVSKNLLCLYVPGRGA